MSTTNQYTDLQVYDKDSQDIFEAAVQTLRLRLPEWTPREDGTEVLLLEAMAQEVAEASFAINRLPSTVMMSMLSLFGLTRHDGSFPTTVITITVNATGLTIPAGARFVLNTAVYDTPVIFTTTEAAYFNNTTMVDVAAEANVLTDELYSVPVGTKVFAVETNNALEGAVIGGSIVGGSAPETDKDWMDRAVGHFQRLVSTLVTPEHFRVAALDYEPVTRAKVLDLYDPEVGTVGSSPGHVTVAVYGQNRTLTSQEKATLTSDLRARAIASLQIHVVDPQITAVDVEATIGYMPNATKNEVDSDIRKAVIEFLSGSTWDVTSKIRRNEIITAISNVKGVDYVGNLVKPAQDVDLGTKATIATPGTVTLTTAVN